MPWAEHFPGGHRESIYSAFIYTEFTMDIRLLSFSYDILSAMYVLA